MSREEAAAKAHYESGSFSEKWEMSQPALREFHLARMADGIAAADAHDAAHGIHRVTLDEGTVERALEALLFAMWGPGERLAMVKDSWRSTARAVLAAAVEAGQ